ncbi:MAG: hypothetical protein OIF48_19980 [Silicimonas sp.]|nr:hypothetical protein [Silicimonas sp.]
MRYLIFCFALLGCADWPEISQTPPLRASGDWPRLVSAAELYAVLPEARADRRDSLAARASALRARAAILRRPATTRDQMEALRARLPR